MNVRSYWAEDAFVVELAGKLMGGPEAGGFHDNIKTAVDEGCTKAVIDLSGVEWLNSWGVGQLVSAYISLKNQGGLLMLSGCRPKVMNVLQMTRFDSVFSFQPDVNTALTNLK
jgi:anti-sigma B factor antagonist